MFNLLFPFWQSVSEAFMEITEMLASLGLRLIVDERDFFKASAPEIIFKKRKCFIKVFFVKKEESLYSLSLVFLKERLKLVVVSVPKDRDHKQHHIITLDASLDRTKQILRSLFEITEAEIRQAEKDAWFEEKQRGIQAEEEKHKKEKRKKG